MTGQSDNVQERIARHYSELSGRLKEAADYVVTHPLDVATRSLRAVSASAELAPATFTRLSRSLGFSSYEEMRELCRSELGQVNASFSAKAGLLAKEAKAGHSAPFLRRHMAACVDNLDMLSRQIDENRLEEVVDFLSSARQVVLFGAYSSTGIVEYFSYLARYFAPNWRVAGRVGASLSSDFVGLDERDAVIVISKTPSAKRAVLAARMGADLGAHVILITDSHTCPAVDYATTHFIMPSDSPQFFSSYVASLVLIETLVGMLVSRAGPKAEARVAEIETWNRQYGEFWE